MEGLKAIPYIVLVIAISGVIGGAAVLVLDSFAENDAVQQCTTATDTWVRNATHEGCVNASDDLTSNATVEYRAILDATTGVGDVTEQLPTVAVIGVMVIIISIIAGVFVYLKFFK